MIDTVDSSLRDGFNTSSLYYLFPVRNSTWQFSDMIRWHAYSYKEYTDGTSCLKEEVDIFPTVCCLFDCHHLFFLPFPSSSSSSSSFDTISLYGALTDVGLTL